MADRGRAGLDGLDGPSAYEIALAHGFKGSPEQWLARLKGERGDNGAPVPAETVQDLVRAAIGTIPRPADGINGKNGRDGLDGKDGARGPRGERGKDGQVVPLPPLQSARAKVYRDLDTKLWIQVHAPPLIAGAPAINLYPVRNADQLIEYIDLIPEPA